MLQRKEGEFKDHPENGRIEAAYLSALENSWKKSRRYFSSYF